MDKKYIIIGAGITGLAAAWKLSEVHGANVIVLEKKKTTGGLAASSSFAGFPHDVGSHRFHQNINPEAHKILQELIGEDLLKRPRKGLIHIRGKFLKYPPSIFQLFFAYGLMNTLRFMRDYLAALFMRLIFGNPFKDFESYTIRCVGRSLYEYFYLPYALKLWTLPPREISSDPAKNRVKKFEFSTVFREIAAVFSRKSRPIFYYPARGIGQVANKLEELFLKNGGRILYIDDIESINTQNDQTINSVTVKTRAGGSETLPVKALISTISIKAMHNLVRPSSENGNSPPFDLHWRSMRILYLITPDKAPSEHETFYFPENRIRIGRVSEPGKYSPEFTQKDPRALLAVEVACGFDDEVWKMSEDEFADLCIGELNAYQILENSKRQNCEYFSERIKDLYPVYKVGYQKRYAKIFDRLNAVDNLYLIGRSALFLHCNIEHCLIMAVRLAEFLAKPKGRKPDWTAVQKDFYHFRVKD